MFYTLRHLHSDIYYETFSVVLFFKSKKLPKCQSVGEYYIKHSPINHIVTRYLKKNVANVCICTELSGKTKKELKATPVVEIKVGEELLFHYKVLYNF